jgi:hypothetical protein
VTLFSIDIINRIHFFVEDFVVEDGCCPIISLAFSVNQKEAETILIHTIMNHPTLIMKKIDLVIE